MSELRRYAGRSAEERRAQRRQRLREVGLEVIAEQGLAGLRVRSLSARAGLNDRYFYENYADTDQLLNELLDEQQAELVAELVAIITTEPADVRVRLRTVVEAIVTTVADNPVRRQLFLELHATAELRRRRAEVVSVAASIMIDQGRELLGEAAVTGIHAELAARTISHGGLDILTEWLRGDLEIDRPQLIDFLVAMILTASEITSTVRREMAASEPA
ncbi:TetR/AcrR family transcriptional regulator [Nocardia uniformis]|uniref:TetR/AcrR family transcriptional regulator n=1 Tax=Nocardia uniformis TaxID=53432 RepID=A0A849BXL4_9NOCA|nr:TetR/AcrR family transcriptional regulator [Nocardia uniformis]NNH71272.1 TetR/AcrR family transcriptional regulator [Nocardia uniformis]